MALIQVDDSNFQKISNFTHVPPDQIQDTDLITGLHNGGNANFRIYDIVSKVMAGIDIDPGQDPGYDPGGDLGEQVTYSVIIDESKSDPSKMCTYADDAIGLNGGNWSSLKTKPIFKKLRNCILENGQVLYYLNPNDLSKKEDGTSAIIGTPGKDVMVEFPERLGYKLTRISGNRLKVSLTNRPNAAGFCYNAFSHKAYNDCDKIYVATYKAYVNNNKAYSVSGNTPGYAITVSTAINQCRARGDGYDLIYFGIVTLLQVLYLIAYCNLDSQTVVGVGYKGSSNYRNGASNTYGFCNEFSPNKSDTSRPVKLFGLESIYGDWEMVFGIQYRKNGHIYAYNYDSGSEWVDIYDFKSNYIEGGWLAKPIGTNETGFIAIDSTGSGTTKYCDAFTVEDLLDDQKFIFGGNNASSGSGENSGGIFGGVFNNNANGAQFRLVFLHREQLGG